MHHWPTSKPAVTKDLLRGKPPVPAIAGGDVQACRSGVDSG